MRILDWSTLHRNKIAVPTTSAAKQSCSNAPDLFAEDVVSMKSVSSQKDGTYVHCD